MLRTTCVNIINEPEANQRLSRECAVKEQGTRGIPVGRFSEDSVLYQHTARTREKQSPMSRYAFGRT
jgi:hypothetical protein